MGRYGTFIKAREGGEEIQTPVKECMCAWGGSIGDKNTHEVRGGAGDRDTLEGTVVVDKIKDTHEGRVEEGQE